jgi:hypothetical protein
MHFDREGHFQRLEPICNVKFLRKSSYLRFQILPVIARYTAQRHEEALD